MKPRALALTALLLCWPAVARAQATDEGVRRLLNAIESAVQSGRPDAYNAFLMSTIIETPASVARAASFAALEFRPGATRVVIQERDRQDLPGTLPGNGYRLAVDAFVESGDRARIVTWQFDIRRIDESEWRILDQERLSAVENLYRLSVNPADQYDVRDFRLQAEDLDLTLVEGTIFAITTDQGVTGLILMGRGEMRFSPSPETEKGQVRILSGSDVLESRFDTAYVRFGSFAGHGDPAKLSPRAVEPRDLRRAEEIFREESPKSFVLDLGDLSPDRWSILPGANDFLAEIRSRRFSTLTYARSASEAEDISVFDRRRQRNIAAYASKEKLAERGRFYDEDDLAAYDVIGYDIDVTLAPDRNFINGRVRLTLETRAPIANQITLRLSNALTVQSVVSEEFGRLFSLRSATQNAVLVNLPASVLSGTELTLTVIYSGRLTPQSPDRETIELEQGVFEETFPRAEPSQLYSSRSHWYPQSPISDYATATIRITLPAVFGCVATGELLPDSPTLSPGVNGGQPRRVWQFAAFRPVRYLALLVSRFTNVAQTTLVFDAPSRPTAASAAQVTPSASREAPSPSSRASVVALSPTRDAEIAAASLAPSVSGAVYDSLQLSIAANPRQVDRGRNLVEHAADVARFYQSIIGDSPYQTFTLALIETSLPGGHSPAYFAALNQPLPNTPISWRSDPANFEGFAEFFLAHEMAHQWWGQAVGWQNYHEQWLSEGFSQYFAGLYAKHSGGDETFAAILRQWRKWSLDKSDQGPVYLGYRLGHIKNDSRVFRALVYNKGAAVLHMLRRLLGDEAFFGGIRRFYVESRFKKAGTEDLRRAMEAESGRSLERFFERWIYGAALPRLAFEYRVESSADGQVVVLRFEQTGDVFDIPVTVTLQYADRRSVDVFVPVTDRSVEHRVALDGTLRTAEVSKDDGSLAEVSRTP
ncbi:MAG: hypothetical protein A3H97_15180 [Acidobacteria bacterium RIFCSPLOWO2_02_FULL_65_29]|nr:MAG: hypothetical protein A3H97_15180 [Acidobacteria bacterium RIFCSPLOWO2_02_FULL_65_29]